MSTEAPRSVAARLIGGPHHGRVWTLREPLPHLTTVEISSYPPAVWLDGSPAAMLANHRHVIYSRHRFVTTSPHPCVRGVAVRECWDVYTYPGVIDEPDRFADAICSVPADAFEWAPDGRTSPPGIRAAVWRLAPGLIDPDDIRDLAWRAAVLEKFLASIGRPD